MLGAVQLFASMVQGPSRQELRAFFASEIPEELGHAQILADKIAAQGGTPAAEAAPVKVVGDAKEMLETALTTHHPLPLHLMSAPRSALTPETPLPAPRCDRSP